MASNKKSIEAGRAHVTLATEQSLLDKGLASAAAKFQAWGRDIAVLGGGIAAVGAAITAPFIYGLTVFADWGAEMRESMRMTGIGFEQLDFLMDGLRVSADQLVPAVAKMSEFLIEAASGSREANNVLSQLGLTIDSFASISQGDRVLRLAEAIGAVGDASRRIGFQRDIFGRGGLALNVLGGAEGIRRRAARMDFLEGTPTAADQKIAAAYSIAQKEMALAVKAVWREIGSSAAPIMTNFLNRLTKLIVLTREWITQHRTLIGYLFVVGSAILGIGTALVGVGSAIWLAGGALGALSGTVGALFGGLFSLVKVFGFISSALFVMRIATTLLGLPLLTIGLYGVSAALLLVKAGFFAVAAASWVTATALTGASLLALAGLTALKIGLAIVASGFGVLIVLGKVMALGAVINGAIASAAMWAYAAVVAFCNFIINLFTASATGAGLAEIFMSVCTAILTAGLNLLVGTIAILVIALGAVVLAFSGLWLAWILIVAAAAQLRDLFLNFGETLDWLTDLSEQIVGFFGELPQLISDTWDALVATPIASFIQRTIELFEQLREVAITTWTTISDYLDKLNEEFEETGLNDFARNMLYAAIGIATVVGALGYVLYDLYQTWTLADLLAILWEKLAEIIDDIVASLVEEVSDQMASLYDSLHDTFVAIGDFIVSVAEYIDETITSIMESLSDFIQYVGEALAMLAFLLDWLEDLKQTIADTLASISAFFADIMPSIAEFFGDLLDSILEMFSFERIEMILMDFFAMIREAFTDLMAWINDNIEEILDPFIRLGQELVGQFLVVATAVRDNFEEAFNGVYDVIVSIGPAIQSIGTIAVSAATQTAEGFTRAFSGISAAAGLAFSAIKDAFALGEWEMLWDIIKITAMIAWLYVSEFLQRLWINWRFAAASTFNVISDTIRVGFTSALGFVQDFYERFWMEIRALAETGAGAVLNTFWQLAANIIEALDGPLRVLQTMMTALAFTAPQMLGLDAAANALNQLDAGALAAEARTAGGTAVTDARAAAIRIRAEQSATEAARNLEMAFAQMDRNQRDRDLADARDRALAGAGNEQEIHDLEVELTLMSAWLAEQRRMQDEEADAAGGPAGLFATAGAAMAGSFFADAFRGMGGVRANPVEITNQRLLTLIELERQMIQAIREIQGQEFA